MRGTMLALAVLPLAACVPFDPSPLLDAVEAERLRLEVGQCVNELDLLGDDVGEVGVLPLVDCDEPHDAEVYYVEDVKDTTLPAGIEVLADDACYEAYEAFTGIAFDDSVYFYTSVYPSDETWAIGDRQIACLITGDEGGALEGSLAGAAE